MSSKINKSNERRLLKCKADLNKMREKLAALCDEMQVQKNETPDEVVFAEDRDYNNLCDALRYAYRACDNVDGALLELRDALTEIAE